MRALNNSKDTLTHNECLTINSFNLESGRQEVFYIEKDFPHKTKLPLAWYPYLVITGSHS